MTELYNFGTGEWKRVGNYPFADGSFVNDYDILYIPEMSSYLLIGGAIGSGQMSSQIAKFKEGVWSDAGQLNTSRAVSFVEFK